MNLWFVFALMTVAAVFAVLWPLGRRTAPQAGGSEASVYRDQLTEIDRDLAGGLIGATEAEAARVEISRRLLATSDRPRDPAAKPDARLRRSPPSSRCWGFRWQRLAFYLSLGSPQLGDFPLAARARAPDAAQPLDNLVAQVEAHLEKNPTDGRGWTVLAPVLSRLGRYDDAVRAWRNVITLSGDSSERRADLGEALMAAAGGVVTGEAKAEFERAVAMNADEIKASYFLGLAAEQDGRKDAAASIWKAMLAKAPADAPWRPLVQAALSRVGGPVRAGAVGRDDGRGQGHERGRPRRHDPRHGRPARHAAEAERRRRRGMAAAGARLYGDGRARQGGERTAPMPVRHLPTTPSG